MLARALVFVSAALFFSGNVRAQPALSAVPSAPTSSTPVTGMGAPKMDFSLLTAEAMLDVAGARAFAVSDGAVWVSAVEGNIARVDPATNKSAAAVSIGGQPCSGAVFDFDTLFVARCDTPGLDRIDSKTNAAGARIATPIAAGSNSIATGIGSLWVITDDQGTVARIDPVLGVVVAEMYTPAGAMGIAFGEGAVWVASPVKNLVTRINPYNNVIVDSIAVAQGPSSITVGEGAVWSWNRGDGSVTRIDPKTNAVVATIALDPRTKDAADAAGGIVAAEGSVWIATESVPLTRIDAKTNRVAQVFTGTGRPLIAAAHGSLWIAGSTTGVIRLDPKRVEATRPRPGSPSPPD